MALRWLLHSACHVLGYPKDPNNNNMQHHCNNVVPPSYQNEGRRQGQQLSTTSSGQKAGEMHVSSFQMPLHYPRYTKEDYERMEEWKVDVLLREYGLSFNGSLDEKREYAMGAFLWPHQY